jgi:23S rRNA (uracil1939-C5)-methyltransferase
VNCNNATKVTIKKLVNGGYGLANLSSGKTTLVQFALPGEIVTIATVEQQQRLDHARAIRVEQPHEGRVAPPCPYYGSCGGCNLQHADYSTQCLLKQQIICDLLQRSKSPVLKELASQVEAVIASPLAFGYRQRIRLKVDQQKRVGFSRFRSHTIIPVKRCLLAPYTINRCLAALPTSESFADLAPITEELEILYNPHDTTTCLLFSLKRPPRPTDRTRAKALCGEVEGVTRVFLNGNDFALEGPFSDSKGEDDKRLTAIIPLKPPLKLVWEAGGFCQVNTEQNYRLISLVLQLSEPAASDRILDLYCGMGNFSIPLARSSAFVNGVESQGSAIRSALYNSSRNGLLNTSFEKNDVPDACKSLVSQRTKFDTIICDPPRQGMSYMAPLLGRLTDRRLIYISCDPATLCRDLAELASVGFTIKKVQPIDMFPQTHHLETVVLLEKN